MRLRTRVQRVLASDAFHQKLPTKVQGMGRTYVSWLLKRMQVMSKKTSGPRMRIVWWRTLEILGRIPRWPDDMEHILDAETVLKEWLKRCDDMGRVDGRFFYLRFLSHRWDNPHFCEACADPTQDCPLAKDAHPDTRKNHKARTLARWASDQNSANNVGIMCPEDQYFWIDFAGIDQDDGAAKSAGIEMLPLYVACAGNGMVMYLPDDEGPVYEERAWTTVERSLGYVFCAAHVLKKIDSGYIEGRSRWPADVLAKDRPQFWGLGPSGYLELRLTDPRSGKLTCSSDEKVVETLKVIAERAVPTGGDLFGEKSALKLGDTCCRVEDTCVSAPVLSHPRSASWASSVSAESSPRWLGSRTSSKTRESSKDRMTPLSWLPRLSSEDRAPSPPDEGAGAPTEAWGLTQTSSNKSREARDSSKASAAPTESSAEVVDRGLPAEQAPGAARLAARSPDERSLLKLNIPAGYDLLS